MTDRRIQIAALIGAFVLVCLASGEAQAGTVVIDFSSGTTSNVTGVPYHDLYVEDGFRVRPEAGDHFESNGAAGGIAGTLGWHDGNSNSAPNILTVDLADGSLGAFDAMSIDVANLPSGVAGIRFFDSNGGSKVATSTGTFALGFLNTTFLSFQVSNSGTNTYPVAIDNLTLNTVPTTAAAAPLPSAAWVGLGLLGALGAVRRVRRRRHQHQ